MTTKADLRTAILADTHRSDLASEVDRFIRLGEGMIRRELTAYELTVTLTDSDRVTAGSNFYNLPARLLIIRRVQPTTQRRGLDKVSIDVIGAKADTDRVHAYAQIDDVIEIMGNPATGSEFTLNYYGMPESLSGDTDTNELLTDHETLYQSAASFYLYNHTQDRELASDQLDIFNGVMSTLNEQYARKVGGTQATQGYNFGSGGSY